MTVSSTQADTDILGRPLCSCGQRMDLARIDPHPEIDGAEVRHYECHFCGNTLMKVFGEELALAVGAALKSVQAKPPV